MLLLEGRERLHRLVLQVAPEEVFTLGKFLILVGIVLPLVPNHPIISWTPIIAVPGVAGAGGDLDDVLRQLSAATLPADEIRRAVAGDSRRHLFLHRHHRDAGAPPEDAPRRRSAEFAVGIVVATAMMYLRIDVVVAMFNPSLARVLLPALAALFALAAALACLAVGIDGRARRPPRATEVPADNPLQLGTALTFAALFVVVALASAWVSSSFGQRGVYALAAITGPPTSIRSCSVWRRAASATCRCARWRPPS